MKYFIDEQCIHMPHTNIIENARSLAREHTHTHTTTRAYASCGENRDECARAQLQWKSFNRILKIGLMSPCEHALGTLTQLSQLALNPVSALFEMESRIRISTSRSRWHLRFPPSDQPACRPVASWKCWNWPRIHLYVCGFRSGDPKTKNNISKRSLQEKIVQSEKKWQQKRKKTYDDEQLKISKFIILWSPKWRDESDSSLQFFRSVHSSLTYTHTRISYFRFIFVFLFLSFFLFSHLLFRICSRCLVAQKYIVYIFNIVQRRLNYF